MEYLKAPLSYEIIQEKAKQFAIALNLTKVPVFSNGWIQSFNKRNGLKQRLQHGESGDARMEGIEERLAAIKERIAAYNLCDIYNMDETGLFYMMAPGKTIGSRQIEGAKKDKTRITIAFTCNADGSDRFVPMFVGHAEKPRCFQKKTGEELGFFYKSNKKSWMTSEFFLLL